MTKILNPNGSGLRHPEPAYDIYCGRVRGNPTWLELVNGLGTAYELMTKLAAKSPGPYFFARANTNIVRGTIDTSRYCSECPPKIQSDLKQLI